MKLPDEVQNYDPECWKLFHAVEAFSPRIGLQGPPAGGKTTTPLLCAKKAGRQTFSFTTRLETPATDLIGSYQLKGGEFIWGDGIVSRAWRTSQNTPVTVVINELINCGPDAMGQMYNLLDDPEIAVLDLPNGERLRPGDVHYVATMNGSFDQLDPAIRDRFPVVIEIDMPHPNALKRLPEDVRILMFDAIHAKEPERKITMRQALEFSRLRLKVTEALAAVAVFGKRHGDVLNALNTIRMKYA